MADTSRKILATMLAALALGAPPRPLAAQQTPQPGQRVRISLADDGRVTGTLVGLPSDSLVLETADGTRAYARSAITQLELSRDSRSHWKKGAVIGGVTGAVATFLVLNSGSPASTNICDSEHNQDAIGTGPCLALAGLAGGLGGALLGAGVGSLLHSEAWAPASLEGVRLTLLPWGSRSFVTVSVSVPSTRAHGTID
jgi:hypothetical protein